MTQFSKTRTTQCGEF